jgi:K+-sensing histidine kinase KdpD
MMVDGLYGELPEELKEPLDDVQVNGRHLLRLINDVLDLAKIEAGRMELAPREYSVPELVGSVRASLRSLAADKGLEFVTEVPDDLPIAGGDGGRITQCLLNLAGNALKFSRKGRVPSAVQASSAAPTLRRTCLAIMVAPEGSCGPAPAARAGCRVWPDSRPRPPRWHARGRRSGRTT